MRYASAAAFRTALEQRLVDQSTRTGVSLTRLRKSVAFSRLLARLLAVAPNRWVLKGGLAMDYRFQTNVRTTKDMDFVRLGSEEAATEDLGAAQALDLGDYFTFEIERTGQLDDLDGNEAIRFHVRCLLAGRVFDDFLVDVGFDQPPGWETVTILGPDILGFAGIPAVDAPTIPLELQVAEKVHAYSRAYGKGRLASTRVKDLIDLAIVCREATVDAATLRRALTDTFEHRGQHRLPTAFPEPPADWATPYRGLAREVGLPPELEDGYRAASTLLNPVLDSSIASGSWSSALGHWTSS